MARPWRQANATFHVLCLIDLGAWLYVGYRGCLRKGEPIDLPEREPGGCALLPGGPCSCTRLAMATVTSAPDEVAMGNTCATSLMAGSTFWDLWLVSVVRIALVMVAAMISDGACRPSRRSKAARRSLDDSLGRRGKCSRGIGLDLLD
jgi:hypothetical protein